MEAKIYRITHRPQNMILDIESTVISSSPVQAVKTFSRGWSSPHEVVRVELLESETIIR